jgi:lactoylglutathione lyase
MVLHVIIGRLNKEEAPMAVKFGYTILYVHDVMATISFYERAFGLKLRFLHESNLYAELETGAVTLAFAGEEAAEMNGLAIRPLRAVDPAPPVEIALICDNPQEVWDQAVAAGSIPLSPPQSKPWGQVVSYVRDLNGFIVEICSEVQAPSASKEAT